MFQQKHKAIDIKKREPLQQFKKGTEASALFLSL